MSDNLQPGLDLNDEASVIHDAALYWIDRFEQNPEDVIPDHILEHIDECESCSAAICEAIDRSTRGSILVPREALEPAVEPVLVEAAREPILVAAAVAGIQDGNRSDQRTIEKPLGFWQRAAAPVIGWYRALGRPSRFIGGLAFAAAALALIVVSTNTFSGPNRVALNPIISPRYDAEQPRKNNVNQWLANWTAQSNGSTAQLGKGSASPPKAIPLGPIATYTLSRPLLTWKGSDGQPHLQSADGEQEFPVEKTAGGWQPKRPLAPGSYVWFVKVPGETEPRMAEFGVISTSDEGEVTDKQARLGPDHAALGKMYQHYGMVQQAREELEQAQGDKSADALLAKLPPVPTPPPQSGSPSSMNGAQK